LLRALKAIEQVAKRLLAVVAAALLWRPFRTAAALRRLRSPRRVLFVRIDDRVGEALLLTPALSALKRRWPSTELHVLVHPRVKRVLDGHPAIDRLIRFDPRAAWLGPLARSMRALRRERYDIVVDFGNWSIPSVRSAIVSRLAGPFAAVIGPAVWPAHLLRTISVQARQDTKSEALQRLHLLSPLQASADAPLSFRKPVIGARLRAFLAQLGEQSFAVLHPGSRLTSRRVPLEAFAGAASGLLAAGILPVATWGPGEEGLSQSLAAKVPKVRVAPPTDLDELAALMQRALLTICNNTGPMHLSVAVGTPTLGLFCGVEIERWGHPSPPHRMIDVGALSEGRMAAVINEELKQLIERLRSSPSGANLPARQG
jgi:ADP-heptose:LPS heptosyltransferase